MLANKYYVIYVEVPTGYPDVVTVYAKSKEDAIVCLKHYYDSINHDYCAVIGITEGK